MSSLSSGSSSSSNSGYNYLSDTNSDAAKRKEERKAKADAKKKAKEKEKETAKTKTAATAGAKGAQTATKSTTVQRKGGMGEKGAAKGESKGFLPDFKGFADLKSNALFLTPSALNQVPGDEFVTQLSYYSSLPKPVTEATLWLRYDPAIVELQWVDTQSLDAYTTEPVKASIWRSDGYARIQASLNKPLEATGAILPLAEFHWRALKPTLGTTIRIAAPEGREVELLALGKNVLETSNLGNKLRVSATVTIAEPVTDDYQGQNFDQVRARGVQVIMDPLERIRLAILTPEDFIDTGQVGTADVMLLNPGEMEFDLLRFRIHYDPSTVKILDADTDNYITTGINIFDGDFHERFPFDFHIQNQVDPERGLIDYYVSNQSGGYPYESGTVARIVYRMLRQAGKAAFWFEVVDPATGQRVTDVSNQGRSLLGMDEAVAQQALHGAEVAVRPMNLR